MSDQSLTTSAIKIEEIKSKIFKGQVSNDDFECLKIEARSRDVCQDLFQTNGLIEKIISSTFEDNLKIEGLKLLINIATNESEARKAISTYSCVEIEKIFRSETEKEVKFLIFRLIFLVSIDFEGSEIFEKSEHLKLVTKDFIESLPDNIDDNSDEGKICIDILRFRYNLVRHNLIDHEEAVSEAITKIMRKTRIEENNVNIIGSCLNVCLGHGPENVIVNGLKNNEIKEIISMITDLYVKNENKDYTGTILMAGLKFIDFEDNRKDLRKHFLSINNPKMIERWQRLLLAIDTSITFLTGEFLLKLCNGNVSRFIRHIGFESSAGYLNAKGFLKNGSIDLGSRIDLEGDSSDEEYFAKNPQKTATNTPLEPKTEEEAAELDYLMKRISEYNEKFGNN